MTAARAVFTLAGTASLVASEMPQWSPLLPTQWLESQFSGDSSKVLRKQLLLRPVHRGLSLSSVGSLCTIGRPGLSRKHTHRDLWPGAPPLGFSVSISGLLAVPLVLGDKAALHSGLCTCCLHVTPVLPSCPCRPPVLN